MKRTHTSIRLAALATAAAVLTSLTACSSGDDTVATDSASDSPSAAAAETDESETETPQPDDTETAAPVATLDFGTEPTTSKAYRKHAIKAVSDGLITMIPSILPPDWKVLGGGYATDPQWWRMEFAATSGPVVLDQLAGDLDQALGAHTANLVEAEDVDLEAFGIGTWSQWSAGDHSVLARELKGSAVIIQATDVETATDLAKSLLPAEDLKSTEG